MNNAKNATSNQKKSPRQWCQEARNLQQGGRSNQAAKVYASLASSLVDAGETDSKVLADAYLGLMSVEFGRAAKNKNAARNWRAAVAWYDMAIDVYRESDDARTLSANLTNMSALLFRAGQLDRAVETAREGLDIAETLDDPRGTFRLAAWNHYAGYCRRLGRLDEAEKTLKRGLSVLGEKSSDAGYLIDTLAAVYEDRATQLRARARKLTSRGN
jgi:tetratricopeptide (TPR) repeat protein